MKLQLPILVIPFHFISIWTAVYVSKLGKESKGQSKNMIIITYSSKVIHSYTFQCSKCSQNHIEISILAHKAKSIPADFIGVSKLQWEVDHVM